MLSTQFQVATNRNGQSMNDGHPAQFERYVTSDSDALERYVMNSIQN